MNDRPQHMFSTCTLYVYVSIGIIFKIYLNALTLPVVSHPFYIILFPYLTYWKWTA